MPATKTVAAFVLVLGALVATPVQADRISNRAWRWTTWNAKAGTQAVAPTTVPLVATPPVTAAPVAAPAPVFIPAPAPAPAPVAPPVAILSNDSNWQNSSRFAATNPTPSNVSANSASVASSSISVQQEADAFINMSSNTYPDASALVSGNPQPWYTSPVASKVFGGTPNSQQQAEFSNEVLQDVQNVFERSGLHNLSLTTDASVKATHTMSVVSGVSYDSNPNVIGITSVGQSGLSFIDKFTTASSPDELATMVANNVSHELMHAFGVADHPDQTGSHVDAADATWQTLTDPSATLSQEAVDAILARQPWNGLNAFGGFGAETMTQQFALETLDPSAVPVPEPTTVILWSLAGIGGIVLHRRARQVRTAQIQG